MECNHLRFLDGWMPCCAKYVHFFMTLFCWSLRGGSWSWFCMGQISPGPLGWRCMQTWCCGAHC